MATGTVPGDAIPARHGHGRNAWLKIAWTTLVTWVRREPAAAQALILAFIALGIAFGWWQWTDAQTGAVVGIAAALLGMFVRSQVTPPAMAAAEPLQKSSTQVGWPGSGGRGELR